MSGEVPAEMFRWQDAMDTTEGYFRDELIVQGQRVTSEEVHEYENMRYFHIVTEEEAHTADNILITLPETIHDERLLFLFSKTGEYSYGQQYEIVYGGTAILLYRREIMIDPGDVLELYIYRFA
jgi:hypothetical protein